MELSPEMSEPLKLTTINNDCVELIFEYLEWRDMITLAETAKMFHTSVCRVFHRKYSNSRIDIGHYFNYRYTHTDTITKIIYHI